MTITFPPDIAVKIERYAIRRGTTPDDVIVEMATKYIPEEPALVEYKSKLLPQNEWEEAILNMGRPIGANLTDEDLSSEGLYD